MPGRAASGLLSFWIPYYCLIFNDVGDPGTLRGWETMHPTGPAAQACARKREEPKKEGKQNRAEILNKGI
jgi:hypothetical protein